MQTANPTLVAHRRQFVVSTTAVDRPGWLHKPLDKGLVLSHCPSLPVETIERENRPPAYLLGIAFSVKGPSCADGIRRASRVDPSVYEDWLGRWVLIADDEVHPDAGATLSVFYSAESASGGPVVSSSAALALEAGGGSGTLTVPVTHSALLDWVPGPASGFAGLARLLPTAVLRFETDTEALRPVAIPRQHLRTDVHGNDEDAITEELRERLIAGIQAAATRFDTLLVPLTSGQDSRLILAAALAAGVEPTTYTFHKDRVQHGEVITLADSTVPRRMADSRGIRHLYVRPQEKNARAESIMSVHTAGRFDGVDRHYIANGQWASLPADALVLRGGLFELGRHRLAFRFDSEIAHAPERWVEAILAGFRVALFNPNVAPVRRMLEDWVDWVRRAEMPGLDLVDRFYLDQRVGCWLGDIEQALDLVQPERIHVANSSRTLSLLLSQPLEVRQEKGHQVRLIEALSPQLAAFPYNRRDPMLRILARRARRVSGLIRSRLGISAMS